MDRIRHAFQVASVANTVVAPWPHSELLEMIVSAAARVIHASRGSLFLIDEGLQELVFEVALDEPIEQFRNLRLPLGRGIAGMVALTGEAMAIADVAADPRHASEIAQLTGYMPRNLVCVPLAYGDRIIGVIELMDKLDADGFSPDDIDTLGLFASLAAITIDQSRLRRDLAALLTESVASAAGLTATERDDLLHRMRLVVADIERDPRHARAVELAQSVLEIAAYGELEAAACHVLLRGFADYLRARPQPDAHAAGGQNWSAT